MGNSWAEEFHRKLDIWAISNHVENMVPTSTGPELYSFANHEVTIKEVSGFNSRSRQHRVGSDAVRYGIAIQESRTQGDYETADRRAAFARGFGYDVGTGKGITVISRPGMVEVDGIIYDCDTRKQKAL